MAQQGQIRPRQEGGRERACAAKSKGAIDCRWGLDSNGREGGRERRRRPASSWPFKSGSRVGGRAFEEVHIISFSGTYVKQNVQETGGTFTRARKLVLARALDHASFRLNGNHITSRQTRHAARHMRSMNDGTRNTKGSE